MRGRGQDPETSVMRGPSVVVLQEFLPGLYGVSQIQEFEACSPEIDRSSRRLWYSVVPHSRVEAFLQWKVFWSQIKRRQAKRVLSGILWDRVGGMLVAIDQVLWYVDLLGSLAYRCYGFVQDDIPTERV